MGDQVAKKRAFAVVLAGFLLAATVCGASASGPPHLPLHWVDFSTYESSIVLKTDGQGEASNLSLAPPAGVDCGSRDLSGYSGSIEWRMVSDYQARMSVDGIDVYMRVKGSFGEPDWSTIYLNLCTNDPDQGGWTTFIGGTGP
jgi:hypothetical protein